MNCGVKLLQPGLNTVHGVRAMDNLVGFRKTSENLNKVKKLQYLGVILFKFIDFALIEL